jgi:hypothetical protein
MPKKPRRSERRTFQGRTLDVSLRSDPRNVNYRMADHKFGQTVELPIQSKVWEMPMSNHVNQGKDGMCVGAATAHWYGTQHNIQTVSYKIARWLYKLAQANDEKAGDNYSGTTITGMMRGLRAKGLIGKFFWIRDFDELLRTLSWHGPVIVGSEWKEGCFDPDSDGYITFDGETKGGHATCWRILDLEHHRIGIQQSWEPWHGDGSIVWMSFADIELLLATRPQITFGEKRVLNLELARPKSFWSKLAFWRR